MWHIFLADYGTDFCRRRARSDCRLCVQIMGHINSTVGQMGAHKGVFQKQHSPPPVLINNLQPGACHRGRDWWKQMEEGSTIIFVFFHTLNTNDMLSSSILSFHCPPLLTLSPHLVSSWRPKINGVKLYAVRLFYTHLVVPVEELEHRRK